MPGSTISTGSAAPAQMQATLHSIMQQIQETIGEDVCLQTVCKEEKTRLEHERDEARQMVEQLERQIEAMKAELDYQRGQLEGEIEYLKAALNHAEDANEEINRARKHIFELEAKLVEALESVKKEVAAKLQDRQFLIRLCNDRLRVANKDINKWRRVVRVVVPLLAKKAATIGVDGEELVLSSDEDDADRNLSLAISLIPPGSADSDSDDSMVLRRSTKRVPDPFASCKKNPNSVRVPLPPPPPRLVKPPPPPLPSNYAASWRAAMSYHRRRGRYAEVIPKASGISREAAAATKALIASKTSAISKPASRPSSPLARVRPSSPLARVVDENLRRFAIVHPIPEKKNFTASKLVHTSSIVQVLKKEEESKKNVEVHEQSSQPPIIQDKKEEQQALTTNDAKWGNIDKSKTGQASSILGAQSHQATSTKTEVKKAEPEKAKSIWALLRETDQLPAKR